MPLEPPQSGRDEIRWSSRVAKRKVRRLYESHAAGRLDEELVEEVGMTLWLRCRDILRIAEAVRGRVRCPRCERRGRETMIDRRTGVERRWLGTQEPFECPECGWRMTWREYHRSFRGRQLGIGGAGPGFEAFYRGFPAAGSAQEKMLLIDRLIHEFHFNAVRGREVRPTRAACVNFIEGRLSDVVDFLDELTYGDGTPEAVRRTRRQWQVNRCRQPGGK